MNLTESQRQAIEHDGHNLQLIAWAGSGKTEVVARRVVHLLTPENADSLQPGNIIAFTFTDKAAAELKERILTRTQEALGELTGMDEMFVGTIHAFCLELLKSESPKHLKYEVLNEVQQGLFVDRNSNKSALTTSTDLSGAALRRYRDTKHYVTALSILREAERVEALLTDCSVFAGLQTYQDLLDEKSYFDYSSILDKAVALLTNDDALRVRLADRIKYLIVDEYQDVNPIQEAIVWSLHELGARICVVGDDDQTQRSDRLPRHLGAALTVPLSAPLARPRAPATVHGSAVPGVHPLSYASDPLAGSSLLALLWPLDAYPSNAAVPLKLVPLAIA